MTFNEYFEFIYLNTMLSREQAKEVAVDLFNKGVSKYEAISMINKEELK